MIYSPTTTERPARAAVHGMRAARKLGDPRDDRRAHDAHVALPRAPGQTLRQAVFDVGLEPLPGASYPRPRRTGWERPGQIQSDE